MVGQPELERWEINLGKVRNFIVIDHKLNKMIVNVYLPENNNNMFGRTDQMCA